MARSDRPFEVTGGGGVGMSSGVAKNLLKAAVTKVLTKKAAEGQSAKTLIKAILDTKEAQQVEAKAKDIAKEIYSFYKKNPKYDTSVKVSQGTPVKPSDVIAARAAAKAERIRAGISPAKAKPSVTDTTKVGEKGKAAAIARNTEVKRQAEIDAKNAPQKQGQMVRGKLYEEPRPGYAGQDIPGKSINAREPKINPDKPTLNELGAFSKLTEAEKKIFMQSDKDAIQAVINATKKIKDMPAAKPPVDINKRLFEASKKLTPTELNKIKRFVDVINKRAARNVK
jgi:hypothetical protein